jgi:hypothetical protein
MDYASVGVVCFAAIAASAVFLRARHNDRLGAMTEIELHEEAFWEAQLGNYNSAYSRELERRKTCAQPDNVVSAGMPYLNNCSSIDACIILCAPVTILDESVALAPPL